MASSVSPFPWKGNDDLLRGVLIKELVDLLVEDLVAIVDVRDVAFFRIVLGSSLLGLSIPAFIPASRHDLAFLPRGRKPLKTYFSFMSRTTLSIASSSGLSFAYERLLALPYAPPLAATALLEGAAKASELAATGASVPAGSPSAASFCLL